MHRCYAFTLKGCRCKIHTNSLQKSYGIDLPVCRFHTNQNVIQKWSINWATDDIPRDIMRYLNIFWSLSESLPFIANVSLVMMTSFTFIQNKKQDTTDFLKIRDDFYENRFIPTKTIAEDCPICMDRPVDVQTLICNHGYCRECIYMWCDKKGTCPLCREQFFKIF